MTQRIVDAETMQLVEPQAGYVDGYSFGDRLLEGVMFEITIVDGEAKCLGVVESAKAYCAKFSKKQMAEWCAEAVELAVEDYLTSLDGQTDLMVEDVE